MKFQFIADHVREFPVQAMCHALAVSVSGYYAWRQRAPSAHQQHDDALRRHIRRTFQVGRGVYGSPRIHAALPQEGIRCGRKRVARLMREEGLAARPVRRTPRTTDSQHSHPVAPNLLARQFTAAGPNQTWVADITAVATQANWLYLAAILDLYSRRVIGWALGARRDEQLVLQALRMALQQRQPPTGLLHHSDRGSQYTCAAYRDLLALHGITVSMSRKGDCYDNAVMESFFGSLKAECVDRRDFPTHAAAHTALFDYLEVFYNRQRLHSALGYRSPVAFEQAANP